MQYLKKIAYFAFKPADKTLTSMYKFNASLYMYTYNPFEFYTREAFTRLKHFLVLCFLS